MGFNALLPDPFIHRHPSLVETFIKPGVTARKFLTLVAKINPLFLVTGPHPAILEQATLLLAAAPAMPGGKIIQHVLECGVLPKHRISHEGFKALGMKVEVPQFFFELDTQLLNLPVGMGKAGFATQAAGGNGVLYSLTVHFIPPFELNGLGPL